MRKLIRIFLILFIYSIIFKVPVICGNNQNKWPLVVPLKKSIHLSDHKLMESKLNIIGKDNIPLYLFECYLNAFDKKDRSFDYTGAFEIRLTSLYDDNNAHRNLLSDQSPQLRDWHSRGVFHIEEIQCKYVGGICIKYPGYGTVRHFRLRGMRITINIKDFKIEDNSIGNQVIAMDRIAELEFEITVVPDPNAISEIAEPIKLDDPLYSKIKWPEISPIKKLIHFTDHQAVRLEVLSKNGIALYLLQCYLNPSDDDSDRDNFDYSGDFECRLTSFYDKRHSTLLTENPYSTRDWESRGRFLIEEITGKCADYPDYGRIRDFNLRGMNLRLAITSLSLSTGINRKREETRLIKNLDLEVTFAPDQTAISEIAEPTQYVDPLVRDSKDPKKLTRDCSKILLK